MRTILLLLAVAIFTGCYSSREFEVKMVNVRLVRIDTLKHYDEDRIRQLLVWKDERDLEYFSYEPLHNNFIVGTRMIVFRKK